MFKVAWLARFPQGIAKADARRHWAEIHGPMCKRVPGIERHVQNHVTGALPTVSGTSDEGTLFDGYSCGWWADREAYKASMQTPEWAKLVEDGDNVFDMAWLSNMSAQVEEHPMIEGPASPYKVVWIVRFKEGMNRADGRRLARGPRPDLQEPRHRPLRAEPRRRHDRRGRRWSGCDRRRFRRILGVLVPEREAVPSSHRIADVGEGRRGRLQRLRHDEPLGCEAGGADHQGLTP
jgi:EthD domain